MKTNIESSYITIQGWMRSELNLKGAEMMVYAIVYGFTMDGQSEFYGSLSYIEQWVGCSRRTAITYIDSLEAKGLIEKTNRAGSTSKLKAIRPDNPCKICTRAKSAPLPLQKLHGGSADFAPNNIVNTITNNIASIGSSIEQPTPETPLQPSKVDVQNEDSIQPKSSKPTSRKVIAGAANFEPPSFEEVKEGFEALIRAKAKAAIPTSISLHAESNAEAFFLCYEPKGWKVKTSGRMQPMKSWRLAIAQWFNRENAQGRYNRAHGNDLAHQNKQKQERLQPAPAVLASSPFSRKVG